MAQCIKHLLLNPELDPQTPHKKAEAAACFCNPSTLIRWEGEKGNPPEACAERDTEGERDPTSNEVESQGLTSKIVL